MPYPPRPNPSSRRPFRRRPRKRSPEVLPPEFADASRGIRLQKVLAAAGVASRRDCEILITSGKVTVNGQRVIALPAWVDPARDRIEVEGHPIARLHPSGRSDSTPGPSGPGQSRSKPSRIPGLVHCVYAILNKPRRVISTTDDPQRRRTVTQMVQIEDLVGPRRLFPVGQLDGDSSGLILLTDDGELANRLTHPRYGVTKEYHISVRGALTENDLRRLRDNLHVMAHPGEKSVATDRRGHPHTPPAEPLAPVKKPATESVMVVARQRDAAGGDRTTLKVILREGQNRQIRPLLASLGIKVRRLQRVAIGPLRLKSLPSGHWRLLMVEEVRALKRAAGL